MRAHGAIAERMTCEFRKYCEHVQSVDVTVWRWPPRPLRCSAPTCLARENDAGAFRPQSPFIATFTCAVMSASDGTRSAAFLRRNWLQTAARSSRSRLSDTVMIGAGIGIQINRRFRLDLTGEYRSTSQIRAMDNVTAEIIGPDGSSAGEHDLSGQSGIVRWTVERLCRPVQLAWVYPIRWRGCGLCASQDDRFHHQLVVDIHRRRNRRADDSADPGHCESAQPDELRVGADGRHQLRSECQCKAGSRLSLHQSRIRASRCRPD